MSSAVNCLLNKVFRYVCMVPYLRQHVVKTSVWKQYLFSLSFVSEDTPVLDTSLRPAAMCYRCCLSRFTFATLLMARLEYQGKYFLLWCTDIRRYIITCYVRRIYYISSMCRGILRQLLQTNVKYFCMRLQQRMCCNYMQISFP